MCCSCAYDCASDAGWSSSVARWAHNPEVVGSNPAPATNEVTEFCACYLILSECVTTNRLLIAMAAAAYIGEAKPTAAIGIPITL